MNVLLYAPLLSPSRLSVCGRKCALAFVSVNANGASPLGTIAGTLITRVTD